MSYGHLHFSALIWTPYIKPDLQGVIHISLFCNPILMECVINVRISENRLSSEWKGAIL